MLQVRRDPRLRSTFWPSKVSATKEDPVALLLSTLRGLGTRLSSLLSRLILLSHSSLIRCAILLMKRPDRDFTDIFRSTRSARKQLQINSSNNRNSSYNRLNML